MQEYFLSRIIDKVKFRFEVTEVENFPRAVTDERVSGRRFVMERKKPDQCWKYGQTSMTRKQRYL